MNVEVFVSHTKKDQLIADEIKILLERVTLGKLNLWFSSDYRASGGPKSGADFRGEIYDRIESSSSLIVLLTPNSHQKPWIHYEIGVADSADDCQIFPLYFGKRIFGDLPISNRHGFHILDYRSYKLFVKKIFEKYQFEFDDEMLEPILLKSIGKINDIDWDKDVSATPLVEDVLDSVKAHIDNRMLELWNKPKVDLSYSDLSNSKITVSTSEEDNGSISYFIHVISHIDSKRPDFSIEINYHDTLGNVMHAIYGFINDKVSTYSYLEEWVLFEPETQKYILIKDVADRIPCRFVLRPSHVYHIYPLNSPILNRKDV